ncbi:preprotein translocase subunit YajC [Chloroflexota bacterium]
MGWIPLVILVLLAWGIMYFFLIKPIRQREKHHDTMVIELAKGDTVITAGGMYGQVDRIDEDSVVLIVESGAKVRVTKGGILKRERGDDYTVR